VSHPYCSFWEIALFKELKRTGDLATTQTKQEFKVQPADVIEKCSFR